MLPPNSGRRLKSFCQNLCELLRKLQKPVLKKLREVMGKKKKKSTKGKFEELGPEDFPLFSLSDL